MNGETGQATHAESANGRAPSPEAALSSQSLAFVEMQYAAYLQDRERVPEDWRQYFDSLPHEGNGRFVVPEDVAFPRRSIFHGRNGVHARMAPPDDALLQERVGRLIHAYRVRGHIVANIDPLGQHRPQPPELELEFHGLSESDLDRSVATPGSHGPQVTTLRKIMKQMRETYCRFIGAQFMHIDELPVRRWLMERMESTRNRLNLGRAEQLRILTRLTDAVVFEEFLQKKYIGSKSFSLEGGETLIPLLDLLIERSAKQGVKEIVMAMAHRGRLNVLANILGKPARAIFREFEDVDSKPGVEQGDVKYHLGHSNEWQTAWGGKVHLSLCFNPSHLEFVNPVALGRVRAKQDRFDDRERRRGMALLIHGDAAFAGEGITQETLNLSELSAYTVGGAIHVVINNQIGFTTAPPEGRSSTYATDVAKMLQIPIFHVNGENPEAAAQVVELALDFRREFQRDVVIDMYCYRRRGHNEGDEPALTQPVMYRTIEQRDTVRENYLEHLLLLGEVTADEAARISESRRAFLEQELALARSQEYKPAAHLRSGVWAGFGGTAEGRADVPSTGVASERLAGLLKNLCIVPEDFHPHPKLERWLKSRREMAEGKRPLDWAAGEALAFASLAADGYRVRLTGQDSARGTFSHRHAVLHDVNDDRTYMPLQHLPGSPAAVEVANSPLSESGVLGFEYGYSLDCPDGLILWEAQYGDFCNAAQVVIDQFLVSAEQKWGRWSGLVLLLPHGLEGQGPEHSSARLERFLELAAEKNIQVVCPTTPAQYFHLLRRQVLAPWRKPLVVMTPKSLLRSPAAVSSLADLEGTKFAEAIVGPCSVTAKKIRRVLLCTGKIYYELEAERVKAKRDDFVVIRVEQLYPLPEDALREALAGVRDGTPAYWVQEEPENMGAWRFLRAHWGEALLGHLPLKAVTRPASSTPASGSGSRHKLEQERLLKEALDGR